MAIFNLPLYPYTQALLAAIPVPDPSSKRDKKIPRGVIPDAINPPPGCRFNPRCPDATKICWKEETLLTEAGPSHAGHLLACRRAEKFLQGRHTSRICAKAYEG